jgi:hypothetical protein
VGPRLGPGARLESAQSHPLDAELRIIGVSPVVENYPLTGGLAQKP